MSGGTTISGAALTAVGTPVRLEAFAMRACDARDVIVEVTLGGICGTDLHLAEGHLPVPSPLVLGHEGIGVIVAAGKDARLVDGQPAAEGTRVMWASSIACGRCWQCRVAREPTLCEHRRTYGVNRRPDVGEGRAGSRAEQMLLTDGTAAMAVPPDVGDLDAMALACAGPTVLHALRERRPVRQGESVVVQGTGPVGIAAMMYARLGGAGQVIAIGAPDERLALVRDLAVADEVLDFRSLSDEHLVTRVREITPGGRGADLVIECTGVPEAVDVGLRLCRRGGAYLVIGQYTDAGPAAINPHTIVYRQLSVHGSWAFSGAHLEAYVDSLPALVARWPLARLVTTYPLAAVVEAMGAVQTGAVLKAVLAPSPVAAADA